MDEVSVTGVASGVLVMNSGEASGVTTVLTAGSVVGIGVGLTVAMVLMLERTVLSWIFFGGTAINDGCKYEWRIPVGG